MSWKSFFHWLGAPTIVTNKCGLCNRNGPVIDLDDGDFVCQTCWDNYIPNYAEIDPDSQFAREER